jgi:head-tail adaptor
LKKTFIHPTQSGALRHVCNIERRVEGTDSTGAPNVSYTLFAENVFFAIDDWKPYESVQAEQLSRQVSTRITIRYRPGMSGAGPHQFRLVYLTNPGESGPVFEYYDVLGAVRDINLRENLTLTCALRDAAGFRVGATA